MLVSLRVEKKKWVPGGLYRIAVGLYDISEVLLLRICSFRIPLLFRFVTSSISQIAIDEIFDSIDRKPLVLPKTYNRVGYGQPLDLYCINVSFSQHK